MVEPGAGVVTIKTRRLTADQARQMGWAHPSTEAVALIEVSDTGPGVPAEIIDKIFEPFFTTKDPGEGTGLGLALVYSIVEEHYGQITIDSPADPEHQRGTRIRVTLPRHVEATSAVN